MVNDNDPKNFYDNKDKKKLGSFSNPGEQERLNKRSNAPSLESIPENEPKKNDKRKKARTFQSFGRKFTYFLTIGLAINKNAKKISRKKRTSIFDRNQSNIKQNLKGIGSRRASFLINKRNNQLIKKSQKNEISIEKIIEEEEGKDSK